MSLPPQGFFGATASTGDLADNHDIVSMKVQDAPVPTEEWLEETEKYLKVSS